MQSFEGDPAEIAAWAMGEGEGMGSEPQRLCCKIDVAYRIMVGAFSLGYHPDWLCVPPSARYGHPRFPAWFWAGFHSCGSRTADGRECGRSAVLLGNREAAEAEQTAMLGA